ncbi:hypothetical protein M1403_01755 [Patescibacteria group bacterium]|nr:hypothetical protein [Patescibacteria group bacterium]
MKKIFYDHLTETREITAEIDRYKIDVIEREELIRLVDENMYHRILDVILINLRPEKHEEFLTKFHRAPHDPNLMEYLKAEITDIEKLITVEAKKVRAEILAEIRKASK